MNMELGNRFHLDAWEGKRRKTKQKDDMRTVIYSRRKDEGDIFFYQSNLEERTFTFYLSILHSENLFLLVSTKKY